MHRKRRSNSKWHLFGLSGLMRQDLWPLFLGQMVSYQVRFVSLFDSCSSGIYDIVVICGVFLAEGNRLAFARRRHRFAAGPFDWQCDLARQRYDPAPMMATKETSICIHQLPRVSTLRYASKYPPAEPVALRLLAPQRGLFATVRSKSKNKSKGLVLLSSLPQHRQFERRHTPGILKVLLPPRQSRGNSRLD